MLSNLSAVRKLLSVGRYSELKQSEDTRDMAEIVARERARAERGVHVFSMILFRIDCRSMVAKEAQNILVKRLVHRLRQTDEIGSIDGQIAVIMPQTSRHAACRVAGEIVVGKGEQLAECSYLVLSYPEDFSGGNFGLGKEAPVADQAGVVA